MNALQFVSSLVNTLAWPGAIVTIGIVFRQPLSKALSAKPVKSLKAGPKGFEVEFFDEKLEEARSELTEAGTPEFLNPAAPTLPSGEPGTLDFMDEMRQLAEVSPSAVVLESFARLERFLRDAVAVPDSDGRRPARPASARALARKALEQGVISPPEFAAFDDVAVLRNVVAHNGDANLDKDRALSYASLVRQLIISIAMATGRTVQDGPIA